MASGTQQPVSFDPGRGRHPVPDRHSAIFDKRSHELGRREARSRCGLEQSGLVNGVALDARNFCTPIAYGYHLVMASQHQEAYTPSLNDIKAQLAQDWLRQRQQATLEQAIEQLVGRYTVDVSTSVLSEPFKEGV